MGRGGEGQEPLEILLRDGGQVAHGHGHNGQDRQDLHQVCALLPRQGHDPHHHGDGGDLRGRGNVGGHRVHGPLVGVRGPEMKGEDRQFEKQSSESQQQAQEHQGALRHPRRGAGHFRQVGCRGRGVQQSQAEEHHRRREGSHEKILDPRFDPESLVPSNGHQDVQGVARELQGQE